ncbi:type IV secretory system conjugative DNA transfer family protein [Spirosoma pollinicola]|uniref:TraD/TraG TraM recognition site domain-containing protein n=1 Tax=Spirosoma pollinicola TaxID=2057025 RepID=A0A2K8ZB87_9BACT|nr:type IV secretory system conjugative DNA transfer family protein [Spirosoma pollinicola]AUD07090.1 hypothetical protein CWM47_37895 [Spirosoma pollinicola]
MGFRQGYESGQFYGSLFVNVFKYIILPAVCAFVVYLLLDVAIEVVLKDMLHQAKPAFVRKAELWIYGALFLFFLYLLAGGRLSKPSIAQASVTTRTGLKVARGVYNLATLEGDIPMIKITKPTHHNLIAGSPGSGKSFSIIEPMLLQAMQQGKAGLVYDYKFPTFAKLVAASVAKGVTPFYINFDDLTYSHRVNPIHPQVMTEMAYARQFATTVVKNLAGQGGDTNGFFIDSAIGYLSLLFWYLRTEHPAFCTIPHAILLAFQDTEQVVGLLETSRDPVTRTSVRPIRTALKSSKQLAAIEGTLQQKLQTLISAKLFWVLSGDDVRLNLNEPDEKKVLVLGNNSSLDEVYSPVLALLASVALKEMNQPGKAESIFMVDEFPTIYLPRFETYPATCRSNGVEVTIGIQDFSQMEERYGRNMKNAIMGTLGNQFFGMQANLESAKYVSELWGKEEVQATSTSQSEATGGTRPGGNTGQSVSLTERQRIKVQDVSNLKQGEFYGKLFQSDFSTFKARIKAVERPTGAEWKPFSQVTDELIEQNFSRIEQEITTLMQRLPLEPLKSVIPVPAATPTPKTNRPESDLADDF